MKKLLSLLMLLLIVFAFVGCKNNIEPPKPVAATDQEIDKMVEIYKASSKIMMGDTCQKNTINEVVSFAKGTVLNYHPSPEQVDTFIVEGNGSFVSDQLNQSTAIDCNLTVNGNKYEATKFVMKMTEQGPATQGEIKKNGTKLVDQELNEASDLLMQVFMAVDGPEKGITFSIKMEFEYVDANGNKCSDYTVGSLKNGIRSGSATATITIDKNTIVVVQDAGISEFPVKQLSLNGKYFDEASCKKFEAKINEPQQNPTV